MTSTSLDSLSSSGSKQDIGNELGLTASSDDYASNLGRCGDYVFGVILTAIGVVSVVGNGLTVRVFRRKGREITVPEILLLNIAMVDLFLAIATYPMSIIAAFSHRWIFERIGCVVYGATSFFLGLATIFSLTVLAVFRYIKTCYPSKVQSLETSRVCSCLILPIYAFSLPWTLLPLFGWSSYDLEPFGLSCTLSWRNPDNSGKIYIIAVCVSCALLPAVAIVGSHAAITLQIRRAVNTFVDKEATGKQSIKAEIQFVRMSYGICFGFLLAWAPYTVMSLLYSFGAPDTIPLWITPIPVLLAKSSIAYNPVIYVLFTRRYRIDFIKAVRELLHPSGPEKDIRVLGSTKNSQHLDHADIGQERVAMGECTSPHPTGGDGDTVMAIIHVSTESQSLEVSQ